MDFNFEHTLRFKEHTGKYVRVTTEDSCSYEGWLKCIDPMTGNLLLMNLDDDLTCERGVTLIINDSCTALDVLKERDDKVSELLEKLYGNDPACSETVAERKKRLIDWIKKHRLPVVENEDDSLVVCDSATISPPYQVQDCSSLNGIILKNVRNLVAKLPENLDEDTMKETE